MIYFENESIKLVSLDMQYCEIVHKWINNEAISNSSGARFPNSLLEQKKWIENTLGSRNSKKLVILNKDKNPVGMVSIMRIDHVNNNAEVGIYIDPDSFGNGYASKALSLVINFAFLELGMHKIYACIHSDNLASTKLFEKLGFKLENVRKEFVFKEGKYIDELVYTIFRSA